ncbi:MAG: hypothetical protein RIR39_1560 [Pseudomonadota bacterium]|jgi:hypothetical protein
MPTVYAQPGYSSTDYFEGLGGVNVVINQLRTYCPSFAGRVAGAAQFKKLSETANFSLPSAYVIPLDDSPGERMSLNDVRQPMIESFAVIVALSNVPDERGQDSIYSIYYKARKEIWAALLGFQPDPAIYRGIEYQGSNLLELDRARIWYQFDFGMYREITQEEGWQGIELDGLPHFDGLKITVNNDPDGASNLVETIPIAGNLP